MKFYIEFPIIHINTVFISNLVIKKHSFYHNLMSLDMTIKSTREIAQKRSVLLTNIL